MNKAFTTSIRKADSKSRQFTAMISTTSVDREGDVVIPSGVKLQNYKKNPVILLGHDAQKLPIGRALEVQKLPNGLRAVGEMFPRPSSWPTSAPWEPDIILELMEMDAPVAFSIGFRPESGGMRIATAKDKRRFGDDVRRVITSYELLEFSVVTIPANQDAMLMSVSKTACRPGSFAWNALGMPGGAKCTVTTHRKPKRVQIVPTRVQL